MGRKRILPEHIKSVKHSFEDMSGRIEEKSSSLIESSATTHLASATDAVKALTKDLVPVIESFDEYLNSVADEFSRIDNEIGHMIEGGSLQQYANGKSDTEMVRKRYITQKNIENYNRMYNDFP
ncbi:MULTISPECIES: hypothetical protein [Streptococcus]|uniref:LXG domain-containing protein n=1 Tax=Streptococcus sinensis TaxID=176090 RepID=A0A0A0DEF9_9STRE|nr:MULTISPECIES: hypothetical protein [Streptococcus]KGM36489.1 hypothetical protein SSIN_1752 [Streptococcus sinensis]KXT63567.1 hypothetical protein STRDD04_01706 [Streptococcus sp. DD04]